MFPQNMQMAKNCREAMEKMFLNMYGNTPVAIFTRDEVAKVFANSDKAREDKHRVASTLTHILEWCATKGYCPKPNFDHNIADSSLLPSPTLSQGAAVAISQNTDTSTCRDNETSMPNSGDKKPSGNKANRSLPETAENGEKDVLSRFDGVYNILNKHKTDGANKGNGGKKKATGDITGKTTKKPAAKKAPRKKPAVPGRPIEQIDPETMQPIATYKTGGEAHAKTCIGNIMRAVHTGGKAGGFYWREKSVVTDIAETSPLALFTDEELRHELFARGWRGELSRTITMKM